MHGKTPTEKNKNMLSFANSFATLEKTQKPQKHPYNESSFYSDTRTMYAALLSAF